MDAPRIWGKREIHSTRCAAAGGSGRGGPNEPKTSTEFAKRKLRTGPGAVKQCMRLRHFVLCMYRCMYDTSALGLEGGGLWTFYVLNTNDWDFQENLQRTEGNQMRTISSLLLDCKADTPTTYFSALRDHKGGKETWEESRPAVNRQTK